MQVLRSTLFVIGLLVLLVGLLWVGQGTGFIPWPKQSFMIDQMPWAYRGIGLTIAGLFMLLIARQRKL